ncbi:MAG: NAD(P)-dependent oxidoreductase [Pseudomonadota bacterium]
MLVAVTGASGLLGRAVVAELKLRGHSIRPIDQHVPSGEDWRPVDLRNRAETDAAIEGVDAVAHLAAWPSPTAIHPRDGWNDNMILTSNVLFAALEADVQRFVYASSQTVLGLAWASPIIPPDYLPVDENHPCRPRDWYGASKLAGEHLVASNASVGPLTAFALRFPVIWEASEFKKAIGRRQSDPEQAARSQWAYIDARDAARAVRLSLEAQSTNYELLNIGAPSIFSKDCAQDLVERWFPQLSLPPEIDAVFDSRRAERVLGFRSRYLWNPNGITISD